MKKIFYLLPLFVLLSSFIRSGKSVYPVIEHNNFTAGEKLDYKIRFGIFTIGKGEMAISDKFYRVNGRDCFKVDVYGHTSGMVDWVAKVDDQWGAYIDSSALLPHIAYRNIKEGGYRKNEVVRFDHAHNVLETKVIDKKTGKWKEPILYGAPDNVREMLSGFLYMRTMDFGKLKKGEKFQVSGFFEDMFYELDIVYLGKDKVKTKAGKFKAIKIAPVMPENKLFEGENSVVAWISDDENKIPLKVETKMFIGSAGVELTGYHNLKHEPNRLD